MKQRARVSQENWKLAHQIADSLAEDNKSAIWKIGRLLDHYGKMQIGEWLMLTSKMYAQEPLITAENRSQNG